MYITWNPLWNPFSIPQSVRCIWMNKFCAITRLNNIHNSTVRKWFSSLAIVNWQLKLIYFIFMEHIHWWSIILAGWSIRRSISVEKSNCIDRNDQKWCSIIVGMRDPLHEYATTHYHEHTDGRCTCKEIFLFCLPFFF